MDYITKPFVIGALQRKIKAMFTMLEHHKPAKDIYDDGRLFGRVAIGLVLSMSGITIALFLVTKQVAVLLLCALVRIFCTDAGVWKAVVTVYR